MKGSRLLYVAAVLLQLTLTGCVALVIREDDDEGIMAGKVVARTLIALPTLGISEISIAEKKEIEEARPRIVTSGSGNPSITPRPWGTLVMVVWGNHPGAISRVVDHVQRLGATVVERARLQAVFDEQKIRLTHTPDDMADLLRVGRLVGADIIVFVDVDSRAETRSGVYNTPGAILPLGGMLLAVPPRSESYSQTLYHASVSVRAVTVQDGTIRWNGTATFDKPISNPDAGIGYLTGAAILRALCPVEKDGEWKEQGPWRSRWGCKKRE